jgi:hypothetical protein
LPFQLFPEADLKYLKYFLNKLYSSNSIALAIKIILKNRISLFPQIWETTNKTASENDFLLTVVQIKFPITGVRMNTKTNIYQLRYLDDLMMYSREYGSIPRHTQIFDKSIVTKHSLFHITAQQLK